MHHAVAAAVGLAQPDVPTDVPIIDLGLDSLAAVRLLGAWEHQHGVRLSVDTLLGESTIADVAAVLVGALEVAARSGGSPPSAPAPRQPEPGPADAGALTVGQTHAWLMSQLAPDAAVCNLVARVALTGRLDDDAFARAFADLQLWHDALRTTVETVDGRPRARVSSAPLATIGRLDLTDRSPGAAAAEIGRALDRQIAEPFDVARGPLLRATLARLAEREHVLVCALHHAAADGWSIGVLFEDLFALYRAHAAGGALPARPPGRLADVAGIEAARHSPDRHAEHVAFWRERLADAPPPPRFLAAAGPAASASPRVARRDLVLDDGVLGCLGTLATRENATQFMALLAVLAATLARHGADDVVVGVPAANRGDPELARVVGPLMNVLPIRVDLSGGPTYRELLARVRRASLEALAHQDVPFAELVRELGPLRNAHGLPFVLVGLTPQMAPPSLSLPGLDARVEVVRAGGAQLGVGFVVDRATTGTRLVAEFDSAELDSAVVESLLRRFGALLSEVVATPDQPLARLAMLDPAELDRLHAWSSGGPGGPDPRPIHQQIEEIAATTPDATAIVAPDGAILTYRDLDRRASRLARRLAALGARPERVVGVVLERSVEMVVAFLGVLGAGAAYLPIPGRSPADEIGRRLDGAGASIVLTDAAGRARLRGLTAAVVVVEAAEDTEGAPTTTSRPVDPANLAYVIYTSGSTGAPKRVAVPHAGLPALARYWREQMQLGPGNRLLSTAPPAFDASVWEMAATLAAGAELHIAGDDDLERGLPLIRTLVARRITHVFLTPSALSVMPVPDLPALRVLLVSAEALPTELAARWRGSWRIVNGYGPTEATVMVASGEPGPADATPTVSFGRPQPGVRLHVLGPDMELVPAAVPGELYIGGGALARGYLGDARLTADRFVPDPYGPPGQRLYRSGDRVRWLPDGRLEFLGRLDDQVKIRGFRVEPGEVAAALRAHPDVREAVVVAEPDGLGASRLLAYVVLAGSATVDELRRFLSARLPEYLVPSALVPLERLPLNASGKVDRRALPAAAPAASAAVHVARAPRDDPERAIAAIWQELLALAPGRFGIDDDFFALGGHSLLATQVVTRANDRLGARLRVRDLFETRTIAALAARAAAPAAPPTPTLVEERL